MGERRKRTGKRQTLRERGRVRNRARNGAVKDNLTSIRSRTKRATQGITLTVRSRHRSALYAIGWAVTSLTDFDLKKNRLRGKNREKEKRQEERGAAT